MPEFVVYQSPTVRILHSTRTCGELKGKRRARIQPLMIRGWHRECSECITPDLERQAADALLVLEDEERAVHAAERAWVRERQLITQANELEVVHRHLTLVDEISREWGRAVTARVTIGWDETLYRAIRLLRISLDHHRDTIELAFVNDDWTLNRSGISSTRVSVRQINFSTGVIQVPSDARKLANVFSAIERWHAETPANT